MNDTNNILKAEIELFIIYHTDIATVDEWCNVFFNENVINKSYCSSC